MRAFIIAVFILSGCICNAQTSAVLVRDWPIPAGHTKGLTNPGFKTEPKFSFVNLGKEKHLHMRLDAQMGTAANPIAPFYYRYLYYGKTYTDRDLGPEPFKAIRLNTADFIVLVQGPGINKHVTYNLGIEMDLGVVSQSSLLTDFAGHVQKLENIDYNGTSVIDKAIDAFETNSKKEIEAAKTPKNESIRTANADLSNNSSLTENKSKTETAKTTTTNTDSKQVKDDFWAEKKTSKTVAVDDGSGDRLIPQLESHKNLPEFIRTTDGKFFQKRSDGRIRELTEQEFKDAKIASAAKNKTGTSAPAEKQLSPDEIKAIIEKPANDAHEREQAVYTRLNQLANAWQQNYYYSEAIRNGKQNLAELSTLSGNYNSIAELEAEFNQKYAAIRGETQNLEQARNAKLSNAADYSFNGGGTEQAIGQGVKLIGTIVNSAKAAKEEKEAKAALKAERERMEAEIAAAKIRARNALRDQLLKSFPNGGTPLTAHKIDLPAVYMFGYIMDRSTVNNQNANVTVSNVFPVNRYSDGTYPLKTVVADKLKGIASGEVTLIGFYADKTAAEKMRNSFITLAQKSELNVKQITLRSLGNSTVGASGSGGDFWETGKKTKPAIDTTKKKDSFWNN